MPTLTVDENTSTPAKTLTNFCNALKSGGYATAYTYLSHSAQQRISETDFVATKPTVEATTGGGLISCTFGNVQENGSAATAEVTTFWENGKTQTEIDTLVQENGMRKINSELEADISNQWC